MFKVLFNMVTVSALITTGEKCETTIPYQSTFTKDRYVGKWYEQKADFFWSGECTTATYTAMPNTDIEVKNRAWFWWFFFTYFTLTGSATCDTRQAECWVTFNLGGNRPDVTAEKANYNILETDYDNYTIVYSCSNTWYGAKEENAWILTRTADITDAKYKEYEAKLKTLMPSYK